MIVFDILVDVAATMLDGAGMPSWSDFATAAPDFAATVRARLDGHPCKLIATLRTDGSPRVSGNEVEFLDDGELRAGSMPDSVKVHELDRDGRFCLHNTPAPQRGRQADAKRTGVTHPTTGPRPEARSLPPRPPGSRDHRRRDDGAGDRGVDSRARRAELDAVTLPVKLSPRLEAIVEALPLRPDFRVLEIGCGPGATARAVAARLSTGHILAVDRSAAAVAQARAAAADEIASGRMTVRHVAGEDLVLEPDEAPYDLVFAIRIGALDGRHPQAGEHVLQRIAEATAPNARLFIDGGTPLRELPIPRRQT